MIAAAIVDDDRSTVTTLCAYLKRFCQEHSEECAITAFDDGDKLLHHYRASYDIIFLDIEMPTINGMQAARVIRQTDPDTLIVFVTQMAQFAVQGYEVEALGFVVKPINYPSFDMVMRKAMRRMSHRHSDTVTLSVRGSATVIPLQRIDYVEVQGHRLTYHTQDGPLHVKGTLSDAESTLSNGNFIRCNRWYLINVDHVEGLQGNTVTIGDHQIEVSRSRKRELLHAIMTGTGNSGSSKDTRSGEQ